MKKPKYPIRHWLGKYEAWLLHLGGRRSVLFNDKFLERFFSYFPDNVSLEQFGVADIVSYKKYREGETGVSEFNIQQEIKCLDRFYRYLIEHQHLELSNPAKPLVKNLLWRREYRKKDKSLRYEEYQRLLETAVKFAPRLVSWLVRMVQGIKPNDSRMSGQQAGRVFKRVAVIAGMPQLTMRYVERALRNGLWREIAKDWANRVLRDAGYLKQDNSLSQKTELPGDPFGTVEVTPDDVWASICNSCENPLAVSRVDNKEGSTEPQGA